MIYAKEKVFAKNSLTERLRTTRHDYKKETNSQNSKEAHKHAINNYVTNHTGPPNYKY